LNRGLRAHFPVAGSEAEGVSQFLLRKTLHAYQKATLVIVSAGPSLDEIVEGFPATQIEIADTENRNGKRTVSVSRNAGSSGSAMLSKIRGTGRQTLRIIHPRLKPPLGDERQV
jgi:hypothetical protein